MSVEYSERYADAEFWHVVCGLARPTWAWAMPLCLMAQFTPWGDIVHLVTWLDRHLSRLFNARTIHSSTDMVKWRRYIGRTVKIGGSGLLYRIVSGSSILHHRSIAQSNTVRRLLVNKCLFGRLVSFTQLT